MSQLDLRLLAEASAMDVCSETFARLLDNQDELASFQSEFCIPLQRDVTNKRQDNYNIDEPCIYLCGNSLGLMPKRSKVLVQQELDVWAKRGVEGHWNHPFGRPWAEMDECGKESLARLVGAKPEEVVAMGSLTSNIHTMLTTFYRPTESRYKILMEDKAFSSDQYAVTSHMQSRGIDPTEGLLLIGPKDGESTDWEEAIVRAIQQHTDICLVLLGGVQYYTGHWFDIERITQAGHEQDGTWPMRSEMFPYPSMTGMSILRVGVPTSTSTLARAGLQGYLSTSDSLPIITFPGKLAGWWGCDRSSRFDMSQDFCPRYGAAGFQTSNPNVLTMASLLGSLSVFDEAGMDRLRAKSVKMSTYMDTLIDTLLAHHLAQQRFRILTPRHADRRGCQVSILFPDRMTDVFEGLAARGVICDERKPMVIRMAPVPLYNSFMDVFRAVSYLRDVLDELYPANEAKRYQ